MVVTASIDYRKLPGLAGAHLRVHGAVPRGGRVSPLGSNANGAQSWYGFAGFQLQPSEFSKVLLIIDLGGLLAGLEGRHRPAAPAGGPGGGRLPMGLIMLQPDLGTALVFICISAAMFCVAGVRGRYLAILALVAIIGVVGILQFEHAASSTRRTG